MSALCAHRTCALHPNPQTPVSRLQLNLSDFYLPSESAATKLLRYMFKCTQLSCITLTSCTIVNEPHYITVSVHESRQPFSRRAPAHLRQLRVVDCDAYFGQQLRAWMVHVADTFEASRLYPDGMFVNRTQRIR
jgi:hypothetical protein